jgi:hypothetical protein
VTGGEGDQVREALERDGVPVVHELGDRRAQLKDASHRRAQCEQDAISRTR